MRNKFIFLGLVAIIAVFLGIGIIAGPVCAKVGFGGKIETNFIGTVNPDGEFMTAFQEHLNLELLLPRMYETSAAFELDVYYVPQNGLEGSHLSTNITKLYIKQRFEKMHLTVGRQPISWSFGSFINPFNFTVGNDLMSLGEIEISENAISGYFTLAKMSNITVIAAFPEKSTDAKFGIRGRTGLKGFDLSASYVAEPEKDYTHWIQPSIQRFALTGKGDLGPVSVYGTAGCYFENNFNDGEMVYLIGVDYSFEVFYGSKIVAQLEYLRDETYTIQPETKPDLLLGMLSYEIDEFAGVNLMTVFNPHDSSLVLVPKYYNLIGSGMDFSVSGGLFVGDEGTQFGTQELVSGMIQIGFGYQF